MNRIEIERKTQKLFISQDFFLLLASSIFFPFYRLKNINPPVRIYSYYIVQSHSYSLDIDIEPNSEEKNCSKKKKELRKEEREKRGKWNFKNFSSHQPHQRNEKKERLQCKHTYTHTHQIQKELEDAGVIVYS